MLRELPKSGRTRLAIGIALVFVSFMGRSVSAQSELRRFEVGVLASTIRFVDFDPLEEDSRRRLPNAPHPKRPTWFDPGAGLRLAYHVTDRLAVEAEGTLLPRFLGFQGPQLRGGIKAQLFVGPRYGVRFKRFGLFGKVRPGAITLERSPAIIGIADNDRASLILEGEFEATFVSLDAGGLAELYVSKRLTVRTDIGDTLVWYRPQPRSLNPAFSRHNLQMSVALGFMFGRPLTKH